jgi:hypothetical protein
VGQKNKLTYRWARKGSRPRAVHDQRTQSTYLFGAVCPERGPAHISHEGYRGLPLAKVPPNCTATKQRSSPLMLNIARLISVRGWASLLVGEASRQ